jgi:hypothetical protein
MLMEMGLETCVTIVPASRTQTRLTQTMILWEMHVTATLTEMGELVNEWFWKKSEGKYKGAYASPSHDDIQERWSVVAHILNFGTVCKRMVTFMPWLRCLCRSAIGLCWMEGWASPDMWFGCCGWKVLLLLPRNEPQLLCHSTHSLTSVLNVQEFASYFLSQIS